MGGIDDTFLTLVGSVSSIANGAARAIFGTIQDKTGFRAIYKIILGMELLFCTLITVIVHTNKYLYMLWVFMGFLCLGVHFVIFPTCICSIFGMRSSV